MIGMGDIPVMLGGMLLFPQAQGRSPGSRVEEVWGEGLQGTPPRPCCDFYVSEPTLL